MSIAAIMDTVRATLSELISTVRESQEVALAVLRRPTALLPSRHLTRTRNRSQRRIGQNVGA